MWWWLALVVLAQGVSGFGGYTIGQPQSSFYVVGRVNRSGLLGSEEESSTEHELEIRAVIDEVNGTTVAIWNSSDGTTIVHDKTLTVAYDSNWTILDAFPDADIANTLDEDGSPPSLDDADFVVDSVVEGSPPADFIPPMPDLEGQLVPFWAEKFGSSANASRRRLEAQGTGVTYADGTLWVTGGAAYPDDPDAVIRRVDDDRPETRVSLRDALKEIDDRFHQRGRRLQSVDDFELADVAKSPVPSDWRVDVSCENLNSLAEIVSKNGIRVLRYEGTDSTSIWDWLDNADTAVVTVSGHRLVRGAYNYMDRVASCLDSAVSSNGWTLDYIVGYSLGGAAATMYSLLYSPNVPLRTYGAFATRHNSQSACQLDGIRYLHEDDPIGSDIDGFFQDYDHDLSTAIRLYIDRVENCTDAIWGICYWWETTETKHMADASSCSYRSPWPGWVDGIYNSFTVHEEVYVDAEYWV